MWQRKYYLLFWKTDQFPEFIGNAPLSDILKHKSHTQERVQFLKESKEKPENEYKLSYLYRN